MTHTQPADAPHLTLDPFGRDHHGEAAQLRELGPVVEVTLPGDVRAWSVTRQEFIEKLARDERVSKDWHNWQPLMDGRIPDDWPLIGMVKVTNMVTADGDEHRRLRSLLSQTFTPRRIENMRPAVQRATEELLETLPLHADADGVVDLRRQYSLPLPLTVIADLFGVPEHERAQMRDSVEKIFRSDLPNDVVGANQLQVDQLLARVIDTRRRDPGDDLTSALIAARDADPDALSEEELRGTLWVMLTAGHETTLALITNATRALLTHPDQRAVAQSGDAAVWERVIEETLRWDASIGNFPGRYALEDITLGDVTIPQGEMIMFPYSAVGRDAAQHGTDADRFDITGPPRRHISFGHGPHSCLGAALARLEGNAAVPALFARYPDLSLAADPAELTPVPSLFSNTTTTLPVRLTR